MASSNRREDRLTWMLPPRSSIEFRHDSWCRRSPGSIVFFEPELSRLGEFVPEDRGAVDVGVWWGPWSWWLARRVPRVDSFEPNPDVTARLASVMPRKRHDSPRRTEQSNGSIQPVGSAWRSQRRRDAPLLNRRRERYSDWRQPSVATSRLDDFELGDVGFVKIDVEGHELAVLQGATDLLKTQRPTLMVEIEQHAGRQGSLDEIVDFLRDYSYSGEFLQKGRWHPIGELDRQRTKQDGHPRGTPWLRREPPVYARRYVHNFVFKPR